jgi:uncharacterized protein (DUF3820 family)
MTPLEPEVVKRNSDRCRKCLAEILWATTPKGKVMPIDPEQVYGGNVALRADEVGMLRATSVRAAGDVEAYVAHFASCPAADYCRKSEPEPEAQASGELGAMRAAVQMKMPFGKYIGRTLEEIDREGRGHGYLCWAYANLEFRDPALKRAIGLVTGKGK